MYISYNLCWFHVSFLQHPSLFSMLLWLYLIDSSISLNYLDRNGMRICLSACFSMWSMTFCLHLYKSVGLSIILRLSFTACWPILYHRITTSFFNEHVFLFFLQMFYSLSVFFCVCVCFGVSYVKSLCVTPGGVCVYTWHMCVYVFVSVWLWTQTGRHFPHLPLLPSLHSVYT